MKQMNEKVILTDCDGVLFDWGFAFHEWMRKHGYEREAFGQYDMAESYGVSKKYIKKLIKMFNESASIGKLPPHADAIKYVKKLHEEHGFVFHAITSLSDDHSAQELRTKQLKAMFGETVFVEFKYLDTGADKDEALAEYKDSYCAWIEDKKENCDLGIELGLNSFLMAHDHNDEYEGEGIRVQNWKEIYEELAL